jgi:hypothetical protein
MPGRHTAAVLFVDAGCFELSAQIAEIDEIDEISRDEIGEIGEILLERTRRGAPATVQLGLAVLSDLIVATKVYR